MHVVTHFFPSCIAGIVSFPANAIRAVVHSHVLRHVNSCGHFDADLAEVQQRNASL